MIAMRKDGFIRNTIAAVLADGQWHPIADVYKALAPVLRPEIALRICDRDGPKNIDLAARVGWGRWRITLVETRRLVRRGLYEARGVGYHTEVRKVSIPMDEP